MCCTWGTQWVSSSSTVYTNRKLLPCLGERDSVIGFLGTFQLIGWAMCLPHQFVTWSTLSSKHDHDQQTRDVIRVCGHSKTPLGTKMTARSFFEVIIPADTTLLTRTFWCTDRWCPYTKLIFERMHLPGAFLSATSTRFCSQRSQCRRPPRRFARILGQLHEALTAPA